MKSIVLFVLCCMVGVLGNAKSKAKIDVSDAFLTYAQFQALTPTERISYIKDVRQFVYNLTKENDFFAGSHQGKALYAMINLFQAEAWAETAGSVTVTNREGKEEPTLTATETDTSNRTQPSGQDPTKKDEGGWWGTQPPAPVVGGELRKVSPQPSVTEPEKPSESAAPTEQSNGGGGSQATTETTRQQPTSPTAISPAQALANKWAAEDMDPKKPCPGGQVSNLSRLTNKDLVNLIEAGIRACTAPAVYVGKRPEKLNYRGVYRPAAAENFVAVTAELERRSGLNYNAREQEDLGQAVFLMRGALKEFNDPMHQPPKGTYDAGKIETSVSRIDALVKKVESSDVGRGARVPDRAARPREESMAKRDRPAQAKGQPLVKNDTVKVSTTTDSERCISAGFVNKRNHLGRCPFVKELPQETFFEGKDPSKFACAKKLEVMCNPFLYGFVRDCEGSRSSMICRRAPLCVTASNAANEACIKAAGDQKSLLNVRDIWESKRGEALYEDFVSSINKLCNNPKEGSRANRRDVEKTCVSAMKVLSDTVHQNYRPTSSAGTPAFQQTNISIPKDEDDPRDRKAKESGSTK